MRRPVLVVLLIALVACAVLAGGGGSAVAAAPKPPSCKGAKAKTKRCRCPKPKVRDRKSGKCVRKKAKKPAKKKAPKKPATPAPEPAQPSGSTDRDDAGMAAALLGVALSRPPLTYNFLPGGAFVLCDGAAAWRGTWQVIEGYGDPDTPGAFGGRVRMDRATPEGSATIEAALVLQTPVSQLTTGGFPAFPDGDFTTVAGGARDGC